MRVLVTGGAGFIGSHVVEQAVAAGMEVAVLDNLSTGKRSNVPTGVALFAVDLRDREATLRSVHDYRPDLVSHQAAQASVPLSVKDPQADAEVNVVGGINLLDACTRAGSHVQQLVFASSGGAIYGEVAEGQCAREDAPLEPKSPYGIHKLAFEKLLAVYSAERGLASRVLRYANVYGARQDAFGEAGVVALFFAAARAGRDLMVSARRTPGDGGCIRDYVHVSDVARANLLALRGRLPEPVLNVCTGAATTTQQLAERILALTGSSSLVVRSEARPGDVGRSLLDVSRFERAVGTPLTLEAGLTETTRWYRER